METPNGVVSLLELLQFNASVFVDIANLLREMETLTHLSSVDPEADISAGDSDRILHLSKFLRVECDRHGWRSAQKKCSRIIERIENNIPVQAAEMHTALKELRQRVEDDIENEHFIHLEPRETMLYSKPAKGWEDVLKRFPETRHNIIECSKCFALERFGGSVFHVLLVAEYGMIQVGNLMGVLGDKPGWSCVGRLNKLIAEPYPDRTPLARQHSAFLENVLPLGTAMKDSWRHKLSHVDNQIVWQSTDFSREVADEIVSATKGFMRKLALELPK